MSNLKIKIDNFEFNLISKSIISEEVDYYKIELSSTNLKTNELTIFFAYISQSGTIWRLCSTNRNGENLNKYDNYIQATILDFRLQSFIFLNYNDIPLNTEEITCVIERNLYREYPKHVDNRGINLNETIFISAELKKYPIDKIEDYKKYVYEIIHDIICNNNETNYEQYKKENNKYQDIPVKLRWNQKKITTVSFYFNKSWYDKKNRETYYEQEAKYNYYAEFNLQNYLKNGYDIIDEHNDPIILGYNIIPQTLISNYQMKFNFCKYNNEYFGIRLKNKDTNHIIIVQIGKVWLKSNIPNIKSISEFKGYYICNIIDESVKITKFGLYETYYTDSDFNYGNDGEKVRYDYKDKYITKPLEYWNQLSANCTGQTIGNSNYNFVCDCNVEKYLIKELIEQDNRLKKNEHMFANKYLKYKQKYLNLKNKLN